VAVEYESALERDFVLLTLFDDPAVRVRSQPITLNFERGASGATRRITLGARTRRAVANRRLAKLFA
jgi:hypothetical protein